MGVRYLGPSGGRRLVVAWGVVYRRRTGARGPGHRPDRRPRSACRGGRAPGFGPADVPRQPVADIQRHRGAAIGRGAGYLRPAASHQRRDQHRGADRQRRRRDGACRGGKCGVLVDLPGRPERRESVRGRGDAGRIVGGVIAPATGCPAAVAAACGRSAGVASATGATRPTPVASATVGAVPARVAAAASSSAAAPAAAAVLSPGCARPALVHRRRRWHYGPRGSDRSPIRKRALIVFDRSEPSSALTRVGVAGFEPTTSSSRTKRATKLRHTPREATTAYRTRPARS